ncbi:MAG: RsmB/NOP family class I SAM-dependent RNA methyltransferase [Rhodocyclaceae bacterium]|nr:RsmB/NOP family class I SAM-dependent RNA methyltransferase [Rhodocyclaceae bacterium]
MAWRLSSRVVDATESALLRLLAFSQPADGVLSQFFRERKDLGMRERAVVAETAYTVLRRRRTLAAWCRAAGDGEPPARHLVLAALVRFAGQGQRQLAEILPAAEGEWLSRLKAAHESPSGLADQADMPDWLVERLSGVMTAPEVLALARGLNQPAPLDLRVNPLKTDRPSVLARLAEDGIEAVACPLAPLGIRLATKPALARHPLYLEGLVEVQDEGSQLLGHLVAPRRGEMVVDFCAGAGGKTLLLGALMRSTGRLYAFDVADRRLAKLRPRVARAGLSNVHPVCISGENDARVKRLAGKVDRVLVDAPCSGLGTLRRNPDLKWRQTPESVAELARKQSDILAGAARLPKAGGRLVYATCSLLPEENSAIVDAFLAAHPDYHRVSAAEILAAQGIAARCGDDLVLLPHVHGTDGFFAAVLERT